MTRARPAGADAFLLKPFGAAEVAHLWQYMNQRRLPDGAVTKDLQSLRHLSRARAARHRADAGGGASGAAASESEGYRKGADSELDLDVSAFNTACNIGAHVADIASHASPSVLELGSAMTESTRSLLAASVSGLDAWDTRNRKRSSRSRSPSAAPRSWTTVGLASPNRSGGVPRRFTGESIISAASNDTSTDAQRDPDELSCDVPRLISSCAPHSTLLGSADRHRDSRLRGNVKSKLSSELIFWRYYTSALVPHRTQHRVRVDLARVPSTRPRARSSPEATGRLSLSL